MSEEPDPGANGNGATGDHEFGKGRTYVATPVFDGDLSTIDKKARRELFRQNIYPYSTKLGRKDYEAFKFELQIELLKLQSWVRDTGERILILFEGRDAAGKGGTIRRVTRYMNEKRYRVVALGKPTEEQRTQWFFQKYVRQFPRGGEVVQTLDPGVFDVLARMSATVSR